MPDSAVLTLREEMPSADSCGDPFLGRPIDGFLPVGCGAEAVFNFSWEKETEKYGSGDDDDDDDGGGDSGYLRTTTTGLTVVPTWTLLSTALQNRTAAAGVAAISVTPNRSATRLPPRFTPSLESRHSSFHHLLRLHMNTFNQRLSMLEKNTLDMKESIQRIEDLQKHLSSQLTELIAIQSAGEKSQKVSELEKSYTDMEARLNRLEGRVEILIDGFTALAQEMNKMKRARHASRSPQERRALPSLTTVHTLTFFSTTQAPGGITEAPFTIQATVPKSIPTPGLPPRKPKSTPHRERKLKSAATTASVKNSTQLLSGTRSPKVSTRPAIQMETTLSRRRTTLKSTSHLTVKRKTKTTESRRSTVTARRVSQARNTKPKEEPTNTKFQVEPPSHQKPAKPDRADRKKSELPVKSNGRNKAFRSDEPVPKKVPGSEKPSGGAPKKSPGPHKGNAKQNEKTTQRDSHKSFHKSNSSVKNTTTKPTKVTNTTEKGKSVSPKTKATTAKKKSNTTVKRKPSPSNAKPNAAKKVAKKTRQQNSQVLDLLQLLSGNHKSAKQKKNRQSSLHVVVGRLAIPIKIIPDY